jgi:hypothetical protein
MALAWRWASGDEPLSCDPATPDERVGIDLDRIRRFKQDNRPHDPPDTTPIQDMKPHLAGLTNVVRAVAEVEKEGLSRQAVFDFVEVAHSQLVMLAELLQLAEQQEVNDGER